MPPGPVPPVPNPDPIPPGPGPDPVPPGPGPAPVPPGPGPSPVPPGPGPSPVPGPPQPIFPPPPMIPPGAGLPAYTIPPAGGASAGPTHEPASGPRSSGASAANPFGPRPQSAPAAAHPGTPAPAGGTPAHTPPSSPVGNPTAGAGSQPAWNRSSGTYGVGGTDGSRHPFGGNAQHDAEPGRAGGTVYGAQQSPIDMTVPVTMNAIENSGSLTGHILAQGWDRGVDTNRRSNLKVGLAMLAVLVFLVGVSLLFLFTAGDAFTDMVNDVFKKG